MNRNITISYVLSFFRTSWFWLGIWVFYYLRFTDYGGIGLVETVMISTMTLFEIPTGAISDLFGRRKTLIVAFLFMAIGNTYMGLTPNLVGLIIAILIGNVGYTLYSGTPEALTYDSLVVIKRKDDYSKVIGNLNSAQLIAMTICGALGGFLYRLDPRMPFLASALFCFFGFVTAFWIKEPMVKSEKFSFDNYFSQIKQGFKQLFKTSDLVKQTILLVIIASVMTISDEMVDSILGVEFGFSPIQLGIFTSIVFAFAAFVSHNSHRLKLEKQQHLIYLGVLISVTYLVSPWASMFLGGLSLIIRNGLRMIFLNNSSILINNSVDSKYRATAISSYNMIKNLPYVFSAFAIGSIMDLLTARRFSLLLGGAMIILLLLFSSRKSKTVPFRD
jgi:MFS family permease